MKYSTLTKVSKDNEGNEAVACINFGTEKCLIHSAGGCEKCPMFAAILNQLRAFEEILVEEVLVPDERRP